MRERTALLVGLHDSALSTQHSARNYQQRTWQTKCAVGCVTQDTFPTAVSTGTALARPLLGPEPAIKAIPAGKAPPAHLDS